MSELLTERSIIIFLVFAVVAWIIGHQSSHVAALKTGQATLGYWTATFMGLETFAGLLFLIWYGYQTHWYYAVILLCFSLVARPLLIVIERIVGLTERAWIISVLGIVIVPVALAGLVWLVLS